MERQPTAVARTVLAAVVAAMVGTTACELRTPGLGHLDPEPATNSPVGTYLRGPEDSIMRIRLAAGESVAVARLYDNPTARDFASLLPVTITLHDLGRREKAGPLPRDLTASQGQSTYRAGQLGYWAPSHDLAVYYHEDGFRIPSPGIVMIGEIESGLDTITSLRDNDTLTITTAD